MITLAIIDPELLKSLKPNINMGLLSWIKASCGWSKGRILIELPRWNEIANQFKEPTRGILITQFLELETKFKLIRVPLPEPSLNNYDRANKIRLLDYYLTENQENLVNPNCITPMEYWEKELPNHLSIMNWDEPTLLKSIRILSYYSKEVDIIDAFFPKDSFDAKREVLTTIISAMNESRITNSKELRIHLKQDAKWLNVINTSKTNWKRDLLYNLDISNIKVYFYKWNPEAIHDRYIIGDRGGINLGRSLNSKNGISFGYTLINNHIQLRKDYSPERGRGDGFKPVLIG